MKSSSSMKLNLRKFDPASISSDSTVILIGKRNTGKSTCLKDLLSYHASLPIGVCISATESANKFFEKFMPKMLIHDEYQSEILEKFMKRQKKLKDEINDDIEKYGTTSKDGRAFLILDDCLYNSKDWVNSKDIRSVFMNGRHYGILFMMTSQYALGIPPQLRANLDYVFIFRETNVKNQMRLYECYAGVFSDFNTFRQVLQQTTTGYDCLVIDNKASSNKLEDMVFWYRAEPKDFKMCDSQLWDMQAIQDERDRNKKREEDDDDIDYDPNVLVKNKLKINVKKRY